MGHQGSFLGNFRGAKVYEKNGSANFAQKKYEEIRAQPVVAGKIVSLQKGNDAAMRSARPNPVASPGKASFARPGGVLRRRRKRGIVEPKNERI